MLSFVLYCTTRDMALIKVKALASAIVKELLSNGLIKVLKVISFFAISDRDDVFFGEFWVVLALCPWVKVEISRGV